MGKECLVMFQSAVYAAFLPALIGEGFVERYKYQRQNDTYAE